MRLEIKLNIWEFHPFVSFQIVPVFLLICSIMHSSQGAPPESLGIPIIQSILDGKSSDGLKELVQTHSSKLLSRLSGTDASQSNPEDINNLLTKLKPKKGRLDPVMTDVLSALDRKYRDTTAAAATEGESSTEQFPDEAASNRVASSTEENGIIWQDTIYRPRKRDRDSTKFSSRYRSNKSETPLISYNESFHTNSSSKNDTEHGDASSVPFNHVTDPNLRNHRLYDWEFETYKNFTHIDQAEDLMAEEDHATETKVSVVTATPPLIHPSPEQLSPEKADGNKGDPIPSNSWTGKANGSKSKRVKVKGYPHIVISLEDTSDHGYSNDQESFNLHAPLDSGEQSLHQRPREPLRHSSTENIVYVHGDSGEEDRYPYGTLRDPNTHDNDRYADGRSPHHFRPSAADLSDAVFLDPDQDFFTSTVRSHDNHVLSDQEISSETLPKRRRKKLKKIRKEEVEELAHSTNRYNNRKDDRQLMDDHSFGHEDRSNHGIHYSPEYSKNSLQGTTVNEDRARAHLGSSIHRTPGPHIPRTNPSKYAELMESTRMKSDRVLNTGEHNDEYMMMNQGQPTNPNYDQYAPITHHHDGGIGNYYSLHSDPGLHANLGSTVSDSVGPYRHKNNYELTSTEYLGNGNRIQNALSALNLNNIFGSQHPSRKLQASVADQVIAPGNIEDFYHPYAASDHQVNQYYEDSYATSWSNTWFILAGLIAFTAIFALLLPLFLSPGRTGKKDHRHDLDEDDLNTSTYMGSGSNNNYNYDNTNNDVNQNSDLWTEIKGVYNDLASMFRGEYSLLSKLKKVPEGPKIVYRDEEFTEEDSEEDEEDDEKTDNRVNLRNRKRDQYIKKQQKVLKKEQQQELKRQQQQQNQPQQQQQQPENQAKSNNAITKKTLLSKSKSEASRDNKDNGKTINATSVNNLVVVSGPGGPMSRKMEDEEEEYSSPRGVTGFVIPDNGTLATMTMPFINTTGYGNAADSFLREWAQVQLINNQ